MNYVFIKHYTYISVVYYCFSFFFPWIFVSIG